ncbi:hypothetical protein LCGC14_1841840 [marine sediment metagenome]|uniref:Uncharacterized protein n=1 Tax=marine sediment metagenome TaxID=412755 RepID=A0A0F9ISI9_9ZZZZ
MDNLRIILLIIHIFWWISITTVYDLIDYVFTPRILTRDVCTDNIVYYTYDCIVHSIKYATNMYFECLYDIRERNTPKKHPL